MKMKNSLQKETAEILRVLSAYKTLMYEQIVRIFPGKGEIIETIIKRLIKHKRILYDEETAMLSCSSQQNENMDLSLIPAFWVIVEFLGEVEYHCPSEFPARIAFFMDEKFYEIIAVESGKEAMMSRIMSVQERGQSNKIIIVDSEKQIPKIKADDVFCFCIVKKTGEIEYFNFE